MSYKVVNGRVPLMVLDPLWAEQYAAASGQMINEYLPQGYLRELVRKVVVALRGLDFRTKKSVKAFGSLFSSPHEDKLYLSVGGGPLRPHPELVNLNIGPFPNVDIVADAHSLPYADNSVDSIYCEAVLEHLVDPVRAVEEMYRVLKPGSRLLAITPFMQPYHGYPHHFQNFTLTGHQHLFESQGFYIEEAGTCVGPMNTVVIVISSFIKEYFPRIIGRPLRGAWEFFGLLFLKPFDCLLQHSDNTYVLASTTYVLAVKQAATQP
jgi:SAM-dependent methyltransferase